MSPDIDESIRCTASSCACVRFKPGDVQLRTCDRCGHGWVAHALEKLQVQPPSSCGPVEVALPGLVFDLSSLILYGAQAVPVRLKILLDRLYSVLTPEQVSRILHTLGWSLGDYVRGYMLQCPSGKVLDRWFMATQDEELLILRQFFRFGETRPIVELMGLRLSDAELNAPNSCQTSAYVERSGRPAAALRSTGADSCLVAGISRLGRNSPADHSPVQLFKAFPDRQSSLFPVAFQASEARCLVPSTKELVPSSKPSSYLLKPSGTNVTEQRRVQEKGSVLPQSNGELALTIKVDPDKQLPAQSLWNQHIQPHNKREPDLHRGEAESTSALGSAPSSSSSLYPHVSLSTSSTLRASQRLQGSSSLSLHPLPAFSSSFLCPPSSSFSSTLHPLPSSLCSLPSSPAAGRKGRVCCGVCGKSFYDKGTLKIHYNAVHLKIKHRCTVAGCTMVFSSLRSRNRHSANPNPRLHTSSGRHAQTHRNSLVHETKRCHRNIHNTHTRTCRGKALCRDEDAPTLRNRYDTAQPSPPPSPHPPPRMLNQENHLSPNDATHRMNLPLQATPPPLLPVRCASSLGSPPSSVHLVGPEVEKPKHCWPRLTQTAPALLSDSLTNCNNQHVSGENTGTEIGTSPVANQQQWWESGDSAPKKKPRKSSMPVKIERGNTEGRRNKEEEEC